MQPSLFTRAVRAARRTGARDLSVEDLRRRLTRLAERSGPRPDRASFEAAELGPVKGEWVRTENGTTERIILYFHGGGFLAGSPELSRPLVARLCQEGHARAFVLAYRLAPEFAFPAGLRDA